jgi:hypothetical protein
MSTRTIIELNHDHLANLKPGGFREDLMPTLLQRLGGGIEQGDKDLLAAYGIRILGQRHHSEPEWEQANAGVGGKS